MKKQEDLTAQDLLNIAYNKSYATQIESPMYSHDDIVQDAMKNIYASSMSRPLSIMYYSMLNGYNRRVKPDLTRAESSDGIEDWNSRSDKMHKSIDDKVAIKEFFDWLPKQHKELFYRNIIMGQDMTEIAQYLGVTRQALHVRKTKCILGYQIEKGIIGGKK